MKIRILTIVFLATTLLGAELLACGDSLYRVGKGVSYRVYTAPLPGNVLVYGQTDGAKQLAEELARSGHGVRLVGDSNELETELENGDYDIVITAYSDLDTVKSSASAAHNSTTEVLPVAQSEEEEKLARQQYTRVMMAQQDEIKNYLKAIHKTLKAKT